LEEIHGNVIVPFGFYTPFHHHSSRWICEGQWMRKPLRAERAWFLTEEVRRAKPEAE
jgi:hypothetical protein